MSNPLAVRWLPWLRVTAAPWTAATSAGASRRQASNVELAAGGSEPLARALTRAPAQARWTMRRFMVVLQQQERDRHGDCAVPVPRAGLYIDLINARRRRCRPACSRSSRLPRG